LRIVSGSEDALAFGGQTMMGFPAVCFAMLVSSVRVLFAVQSFAFSLVSPHEFDLFATITFV
jgi:hypothetical protein